jgi:hypothetical protein
LEGPTAYRFVLALPGESREQLGEHRSWPTMASIDRVETWRLRASWCRVLPVLGGDMPRWPAPTGRAAAHRMTWSLSASSGHRATSERPGRPAVRVSALARGCPPDSGASRPQRGRAFTRTLVVWHHGMGGERSVLGGSVLAGKPPEAARQPASEPMPPRAGKHWHVALRRALMQLRGHGNWPLLTVGDRCEPLLGARRGHGRRGRTWLEPGGNGSQLMG